MELPALPQSQSQLPSSHQATAPLRPPATSRHALGDASLLPYGLCAASDKGNLSEDCLVFRLSGAHEHNITSVAIDISRFAPDRALRRSARAFSVVEMN